MVAVPSLASVATPCAALSGTGELLRIVTLPCGVPPPEDGLTVTVKLIASPCCAETGETCIAVVVGLKVIEFQSFIRTLASTDPRPLARSYPAVAGYSCKE